MRGGANARKDVARVSNLSFAFAPKIGERSNRCQCANCFFASFTLTPTPLCGSDKRGSIFRRYLSCVVRSSRDTADPRRGAGRKTEAKRGLR